MNGQRAVMRASFTMRTALDVLFENRDFMPLYEMRDAVDFLMGIFDRYEKGPKLVRKCLRCHDDVIDDYMLENDVWRQVAPSYKGHLHLACVEVLLGRRLRKEDFKNIAMNSVVRYVLSRDV